MAPQPRASELTRLAGSLLCVGVPGPSADDALLERLHGLEPGGIVLFARNVTTPEETRVLAQALAEAPDGLARAICVDQEGGRVARIPMAVPMPGMLGLGAADDAELAERAGRALASAVRAIGAGVDFAPVLDLALEARSTVIGTRSLGDDPARVAVLGAALVRGIVAGGVAPVPKHFPGHGATADDSHVSLPVVAADRLTLTARDWPPFVSAFAAGAAAVMTAHVLVPALDRDLPATLSPRVLRDTLRGELGFRGVCFTDCLEMDAVAARFGIARAAVLAVAAGADALLFSHTLSAAFTARDAIVAAVTGGDLTFERVEEAAARMAAFRQANAARTAGRDTIGIDADAVAREIAARAIVLVRGDIALDTERPVTIVSFEGSAGDGVARGNVERPSLNLALRRRRVRSELLRVPLEPEAAMLDALLDVVGSGRARPLVILIRRAHLHAPQREATAALLAAAPGSTVVSMLEPFDIACFPQAQNAACCFGDEVTSVEALADVLAGRSVASGRMPVRLATAGV